MGLRGYNFRATLGYVTDPANHVGITASPIYPTVDGYGLQSGWVTDAAEVRDRNDAVDPRLAGVAFANTNDTRTFRIGLNSAGPWEIRLAIGDINNAQTNHQVRVLDDATAFISILSVATGAGEFRDATGALHTSAANWIANNTAVTRTFVSTTLNLQIGPMESGSQAIAHLSITDVSSQARVIFHAS
jgi:hypothetical protein